MMKKNMKSFTALSLLTLAAFSANASYNNNDDFFGGAFSHPNTRNPSPDREININGRNGFQLNISVGNNGTTVTTTRNGETTTHTRSASSARATPSNRNPQANRPYQSPFDANGCPF